MDPRPLRDSVQDALAALVPGLVVAFVVLAPLGRASLPGAGEVVLGLALAYVAGLVSVEVARDRLGTGAPDPEALDEPLRGMFLRRASERFGLSPEDPGAAREALMLARAVLVQRGQAGHASRHEALRRTARGLWAALRAASAWAVGLAAATLGGWGLLFLGIVAVLVARRAGVLDHLFDADPGPALQLPALLALAGFAGFVASPYAALTLEAIAATVVAVGGLEVLAARLRAADERLGRSWSREIARSFVVLEDPARSS